MRKLFLRQRNVLHHTVTPRVSRELNCGIKQEVKRTPADSGLYRLFGDIFQSIIGGRQNGISARAMEADFELESLNSWAGNLRKNAVEVVDNISPELRALEVDGEHQRG